LNVLITRPLKQSANLEKLVKDLGYTPLLFPTLEVRPIECDLYDDDDYDVVIFISKNAVKHGIEAFESIDHDHLKVFAVGSATAKELQNNNIKVDAYPENKASSEELLSLYKVKRLKNQKILIFRGKGGRETLKQGLEANSNTVDYAEVYERISVEPIDTHLKSISAFLEESSGVVTITSVESLESMVQIINLFDPSIIKSLVKYPLVLLSERIANSAKKIGFSNIYISDQTNDKGLIETIKSI